MYFDIQHHEIKIIFAIPAFENDNIVEMSPMPKRWGWKMPSER